MYKRNAGEQGEPYLVRHLDQKLTFGIYLGGCEILIGIK